MMRVALITDGIWPYVLGGMQKHSYYLCKYLAREKVYVDLYHFNQSQYNISLLEFFTEEEKQYITSYIVEFPTGPSFPGHYIYKSYQYSKLIFEAIKERLPLYDLIYTKGFTGWHLINQKFEKKITCAKIGVKFHGYEMFQRPPDFKIKIQHWLLLRWPVRLISRRADLVFSYGGKITELIRSIGVSENKIIEMPSGVEVSVLSQNIRTTGAKIKFLFLGRYERRKGIEELNTAIDLIFSDSKIKEIEFHFIGPIPEDKKITRNEVIYHGEIRDKPMLQKLMRDCDVLICPSWSEGMPNVILEAMANGLSVIATDVGATNIMVTPATGWLIQHSDPQLIKTGIQQVLKLNAAEMDQKKQNALEHIRNNFTWEKLITLFVKKVF